jgi:hypothetical protein
MSSEQEQPPKDPDGDCPSPPCGCRADPFASLPPNARPRPRSLTESLPKLTCQGCGLVFRTNRQTTLCMDCEKKASRLEVEETHETNTSTHSD